MSDDSFGPQTPRNRPPAQPKPAGPGGGMFLWFLIFGLIALGIYALYFQSKKGRREALKSA